MSEPQPLLFSQSRHQYVDEGAADWPRANADGLPVVAPTPEQRYLFDAQGWILIPGLLGDAEVEEMRAHCERLHNDPDSLPVEERSPVGGPLQRLADHPFIVGFMNEFLANPDLSSQDGYGFRMESTHLCVREKGEGNFGPHNGNGLWRLPGDGHHYRCVPGKARSGLTCVVWELNEVEHGGGGTLLVNGSHKSAFMPPVQDIDSPLWTTYGCPAGSLLIFAEGTTHSTAPWQSAEVPRMAIFSRYNYVNSKWHKWEPHAELLASMPAKRRTLFRPVHVEGNLVGV